MKAILFIKVLLLALSYLATAQTLSYGPYFRWPLDGRIGITSYYDHDQSYNGILTRFDRAVPDPENIPCKYEFSCYDHHEGLDLQAGSNTPFFAVASGRIICTASVCNKFEGGVCVQTASRISILHNNGFVSDYLHYNSLSNNPATNRAWAVGDNINEGAQIGLTGDVGAPGAAHLHFGVRKPVAGSDCDYTWANFVDPLGKFYKYSCFFKSALLVDDNSNGFIPVRSKYDTSWKNVQSGYNQSSQYTNTGKTDEAEAYAGVWFGNVPQRGYYKVYAYIPAYADAIVKYRVFCVDNISKNDNAIDKEINQANFDNQWADLGTHFFETNRQCAVYVNNMKGNNSSNNKIAFDAVKWEFMSDNPNTNPTPSPQPQTTPGPYANEYVFGNQSSLSPVVPPQRTYTYAAPLSISTTYSSTNTQVNVPLTATLIFTAGSTVTLRPGFYAQGTLNILVPRNDYISPPPNRTAAAAQPVTTAIPPVLPAAGPAGLLHVFPSITAGQVMVEYTSPNFCNKAVIRITSASGIPVYQSEQVLQKGVRLLHRVDLSAHPAGVYIVELRDCKTTQAKKVVKL
jgi:murein DD-endopeptidase MepM/ murein hydrolase activator NlpD